MSQIENEAEKTKLEKYLLKHKDVAFVTELLSLDKAALEERMKKQALFKQETITAKNGDEGLASAKSTANNLAAPYNDSIRMNDRISRFIALILKDNF